VPYAVRRTETHLDRFERLAGALESGAVEGALVAEIEEADPIFPDLDPGLFA
jgi:1,4-alpha-glucan branching enzyme